jgi:hypothetical protein
MAIQVGIGYEIANGLRIGDWVVVNNKKAQLVGYNPENKWGVYAVQYEGGFKHYGAADFRYASDSMVYLEGLEGVVRWVNL